MIEEENKSNQQPRINTNQPEQQSSEQHQYRYQRKYPRFSSVRLSHANISRIKAPASRYNQTIDDLMTIILGQLDYYEKHGYPEPTHTDGGAGRND